MHLFFVFYPVSRKIVLDPLGIFGFRENSQWLIIEREWNFRSRFLHRQETLSAINSMETSGLSPMQLSYLRNFLIISIWKLIHKCRRRKIKILFTLQIYYWTNIKRRRINRCWLMAILMGPTYRHSPPPRPLPPSSNLGHPPKIVSKRFSDDLEQKKCILVQKKQIIFGLSFIETV